MRGDPHRPAAGPCGPLYLDEAFADPQVRHLELVGTLAHSELGDIGLVHNAVAMTGTRPTVRTPTPVPGEHSAEVLREFGCDDCAIAALRREEVIPEEQP